MAIEFEQKIITDELSTRIQYADPLFANQFMSQQLPALNNSGDVETIIWAASRIIPIDLQIEQMGYAEAHAAMRDLGMVAASIVRHGKTLNDCPGLEAALMEVGNKLGENPRDTIFHYAPWNPFGARRRTFTGTEGERIFIQSLVDGMSGIDSSVLNLLKLQNMEISDPNFAKTIDAARNGFENMVGSMVEVYKKITPVFFSTQLRPYFPVINIGGHDYTASGGAQIPILHVDMLLWGADLQDDDYRDYVETNLRYLPKVYRKIEVMGEGTSLVARLANAPDGPGLSESKRSTVNFLNSILQFRYPHLKVAKENFAIRPDGSKGSGGYDTGILEVLLEHTLNSRKKLECF